MWPGNLETLELLSHVLPAHETKYGNHSYYPTKMQALKKRV